MGGKFEENGHSHNSSISWGDMFHSASSLNGAEKRLSTSLSAPVLQYNSHTEKMEKRLPDRRKGSALDHTNASDGRAADRHRPGANSPSATLNKANFQLAIYIAMAHAGLAIVVVVLYGVGRLLEDFGEPIQWAVLCSMPLREVQEATVTFWTKPLQMGFVETLVAPPIAVYRAILGTLLDAREGFLRFVGKGQGLGEPKPVGFAKLFQWLVSFAVLTLWLDCIGPAILSVVAFVGLLIYAAGTRFGVAHLTNVLSSHTRTLNRREGWLNWAIGPFVRASKAANRRMSRKLIGSLHTIVAVGLITTMILGSLGGLVLFSYKVGIEGKDAVVMIKVHLQQNNYAEKIGLSKWIEDNKVSELIDTYTAKGYEALLEQVDSFAEKNNLTEFVDVGKEFLTGLIQGDKKGNEPTNKTDNGQDPHPLLQRLRDLHVKVRQFDYQGVISEVEGTFVLFLEHFQMQKEDFMEKAKQVAQRSTDVGKQVLSSGTNMVQGGASVLLLISSSIASGAKEILNFVTQSVVFFSVLYYLITSKTGGVMEQILEMVPLSEPTRKSCAKVLDHAVSSVLLATVKTALFQGSFTWLLFRFCDIHFLYGSTLLALVQAFLPLFPNWLPTIPLAIELAMGSHYIGAGVLMVVYMWVMDYGVGKIQNEIPGHNAYLTGLSIAGGMALFTPALEGAIMGPLLMTVLIASKNLYAEFVLSVEAAGD